MDDVIFAIVLYILSIIFIVYLIRKYRFRMKRSIYSYSNARLLGLIVFLICSTTLNISLFIYDLTYGYHGSVNGIIESVSSNAYTFSMLMFPLAIILTVLMTISNLKLVKEEGRSFSNMLGIILGGFINIATVSVILFSGLNINNVFFLALCDLFAIFIAYIECVFIGTCVLGVKAAKHIPEFDKDAILILGCHVLDDGSLPRILRSRVDRAIEFGIMQKEETGKDIVFVPSGGKGSDEVMSEAEAMETYLLKHGVKKQNIIVENKSKNTYENVEFSDRLIKRKKKNARIAFSTTNYHVFRAGVIANEQGFDMEGIGAKTKSYFWGNAFIREFIATLVSEKKRHLKTFLYMTVLFCIIAIIFRIN